ncbi:integrase, catalytic region, zinc finger, CCHC-type containing protein [Tanacetum coccineum]
MGTKVTSSSGSVLEEQEIQKLQMQAKNLKENSLNKLNALKTTIQHLSSSNYSFIMSTPVNTSSTDSQMHNNIMAAGTERSCIFEGPYTPTSVLIAAVEAAENILPVAAHEEAETIHNMTTENKLYFQAEKEAIFLILTGIGDEIYSTVDACNTTKEMWTAIERLQQGESLNVQDVKTNLFWEFGKFTSRDGESMESYYSRKKPRDPRTSSAGIKDMKKKLLALLAKYFKKLYKPTNNNLRTSSNSRNKTEDTTPRYNNDNQSGQFGNQRTMTVAGARETVGSPVVQQNGIQCFNCKGFGHYARECRKPKRVKDYAYHKEKMMMCKQAEQGVPLQAEQADWLEDTDEEIDEQELEAHYSYMAKIQEVSPEESSSTSQPLEQVQNHDENDVFANVRRHSEQPESINDTYVLEKDDSNVIPDSSNICTNDNQVDQNAAECVDERAALANLIANLTLDTEENKTVLKQLKKANASLTQELKECKTNLDETSRALGEATSSRDSCLIALQTKQTELEKYTALNDRTSDYKILQTKLNETLGLLALKDIDIQEGLKTKAYEISVVNQKHDELVRKSLLTRSQFEGQLKEKSKVISDLKKLGRQCREKHQTFANPKFPQRKLNSEMPRLYEIPYVILDPANRFCPSWEETVTLGKGFPAQSVGSSDTDVLDSPCLLVLITGTSQSRQHGPVPQCSMTFEQCSSSLGHQCLMMSVHVSSGLVLHQMTSDHNRLELEIHDHNNEPSSSKLVPKVVPLAFKTATLR